ncbi:MAG: Ig-like domain-containing domain [Vicingaceae bacterium]
MMRKKVFKSISIFLGLSLFVMGCAQVVAPTGGEKDTQPPRVEEIKPENETKNFSREQSISITFDEFVKLDQINEKVIVSPPLKHQLQTKLRGKTLHITFEDTLKEDATYVLNFNESIVDITENNPLDFTYVFSTGDKIDSLAVSGRLVNAFDLKVVEDTWVALYDVLESDSLPMKEIPTYLDKTDKEGLFRITNVKAGKYRLLALADENKNLLIDKPTEKIAFHHEVIELDGTSAYDSLKLFLFEEDKQKLFVKETGENGVNVILEFSRPTENLSFSLLDTNIEDVLIDSKLNEQEESLTLWFKNMPPQRFRLLLSGSDYADTVKFKTDSLKSKSKLSLTEPLPASQPYYVPLRIAFNRPIKSVNKERIQLLSADSVAVDFEVVKKEDELSIFHLKADFMQDSTYHLLLRDSAFIDVYGRTNDSIPKTFSVDSENNYSMLSVEVESKTESPKVIQLLDGQGEVLREQMLGNEMIHFEHLKAGKFGLKLIMDANGNGKWDSGDYIKKVQPESVWIYEEEIDLRSNWDREIKWIIAD